MRFLRYWNKARFLPQHWNMLLTKAKVDEVLQNPIKLFRTYLQDPGTDINWTCSLGLVQSLKLVLNLTAGDKQAGGRDRGPRNV